MRTEVFSKLKRLFSFKGKFNRKRFWLTLIIAWAIELMLEIAFPISRHKIILSTFGGSGESSVTYPSPIEPVTAHSWAMFFVHFLITIPLAWTVFAALVKRLHDRERSGKWVAFVLCALATVVALEATLPHLGVPLAAADTVTIVLMVPVCILAAWGLFEAGLLGGSCSPPPPRWLRE